MYNRKSFLKKSSFLGLGSFFAGFKTRSKHDGSPLHKTSAPLVVSTWAHGIPSNLAAWEVLSNNGKAIDAVEKGVQISEGDPDIHTVGIGGYPDRDGFVTLDSCIMNHKGNAGSVAAIQHIKHPVKVARKVMENTPHVMLAGEGALQFALKNGFNKENLLTDEAKQAWEKWKKNSNYHPVINIENHDTIGMIALDSQNNLSGAVTTSGLSWKMHGRVGDSPIIGAGLFVDNKIGAACGTGVGEEIIKTAGSHTVVEFMRQGHSPTQACKEAVERIISNNPGRRDYQVAYIAINKQGEYGAYSIRQGFNFAVLSNENNNVLLDAEFRL